MLGRQVNRWLSVCPPGYPWGNTLPLLTSADALVLNLECVVSDRGQPTPAKVFTFRTDARNVAVLEAAKVTTVSLANNHSLDFGAEALDECLEILSVHGIGTAGAGRSWQEASAPCSFSVAGLAVALVAFTDNEPGWEAGLATPGTFYVPVVPEDPRMTLLLSTIERAATAADLVIVSAHWGPNWRYRPLPEHVAAARRFIDVGAGVVFGHSPHVVRAIELYRGKPILYGCGDFIDDYAVHDVERNDQSGVFVLDYEGARLQRLFVVPTMIERLQARLATDTERADILRTMRDLCRDLGTRTRETPDGMDVILS